MINIQSISIAFGPNYTEKTIRFISNVNQKGSYKLYFENQIHVTLE